MSQRFLHTLIGCQFKYMYCTHKTRSERSAFLKYKHFMNISDKMLELDRIYTIDQLSSYSGELFIAIHFLLFAVLYRECFAFISERKNLGYENELN